MLLRRLAAEGLRGGPLLVEPADRVERVADAERVAEAIELAAAALDRSRLRSAADRLGWVQARTEVGGDPQDPDLVELAGAAVRRVVDPAVRAVTLELSLGLDPTLFGRFRELAPREPRLGPALAADAPLVVKVGWFFSRAHATASPTTLSVRLGDVAFETTGKDRAPFLPELLPDLGRRLRATDPFAAPAALARRLARASLSPDPEIRDGYARLREAAVAPPFGLPPPEVVEGAEGAFELAFGAELASLRRAGRAAVDAVRVLADAFVERPDVLVLPEPLSDDVLAWWLERVGRADAPVEQVLAA